jgi:hypothetical protein
MKKIDQKLNDLIYNISLYKDFWCLSIPYVDGGIYDRINENLILNKNNDSILENEDWGWVKIYSKHEIYLIKPSMKNSPNNNTSYSGRNFSLTSNDYLKIKGIVKLRKYIYKSVKKPGYTAVTYGDSVRVIQPFKIMNHKFSNVKDGVVLDAYSYFCKKCGMKSGDGKFPIEMLNCEEFIMKDIII